MPELPLGWIFVSISDATEKVPNVKPEDHPDKEFGYIDISSICNSTYSITDVKRFKGADAPSRARRPIRPNDILFSNVRTYLRNIAIVPQDTDAEICSTGFTVLRPKAGVDPHFLFRYVLTNSFIDRVTPQQTGTHYPATSDRVLMSELIPLPPLNEQRRIVAKLEDLLAKVEACRERLAKIPVILKRFRKSVLAAACSGRLTDDWRSQKGGLVWEEKTLGDLIVEKPKNGYSARPVKYRTPFRVLTLTATTSGNFRAEHFKYFDGPVRADSELWLQPNDIVVQRGNTIEYVGVPAIYEGQPNEFIYPDLMMRLRARPAVVPKFLYFALSCERSRNYLRKKATGTAGSMPKINQQTLISVPIDLPLLAEQREIVRRVEVLFKLAEQIEARYKKALAQVDRLTQSILAKAFRGELVPTDAELARRERR